MLMLDVRALSNYDFSKLIFLFGIKNRVNTQKAGFFIEDLFDAEGEPKGTKVRVEIPLDYRFSVD